MLEINLDREVQPRCYECFRPQSLCFCDAIPSIDNRTKVLILQHVGERSHPFNTARIVNKALRRCELIADHNRCFGDKQLPIDSRAGLLYPGANARSLDDVPVADRPSQLVIIDGTWNQAKTIVRDVPQLRELPCYRLAPTSPGQYRIRLEPDAQSLSTLEATVAALNDLEPDTAGLDLLLGAFNEMVERQLEQMTDHSVWRKRQVRESSQRYLPRKLLQDANRLVIAYGEATPGEPGERIATPLPVNWIAHRLGTSEQFRCCLQQQHPLPDAAMKYMQLSPDAFADAISRDEFCSRWSQFLRPDDTLIVYHQRTYDLLRNIGADQPHCLMLKSTFGQWQTGVCSLEELVVAEQVTLPPVNNKTRGEQRLDMAMALVEHLRIIART